MVLDRWCGGGIRCQLPTCQDAGGDRCANTAAECAGLFTLASSDCVSCCKLPSNPVFDAQWADPYIVRNGDTYYTFATGSTVRRRSSKDLVKWTTADTALASAPWKKADAGFWAPAVYQAKSGKWILYYGSEIKGSTSQHRARGLQLDYRDVRGQQHNALPVPSFALVHRPQCVP